VKTYIDSDGVLSDFHGWVASHHNGCLEDCSDIDRCIIENYENCYISARELPGKDLWMVLLATDPDWFVLSSVGSLDRFLKSNPELGTQEVNRRYQILRENKYRWFEERGVPRDKVILVDRSRDKVDYCQEGDVLYDDYDKTLDAWLEAGGMPVKVYNKYKDIF